MDIKEKSGARQQNQIGRMLIALFVIVVLIGVAVFVILLPVEDQARSLIPADSRQLLVVNTPSQSASKGELYRFKRSESRDKWQKIGQDIPIILGVNGLAWGRGLHKLDSTMNSRKVEGDGCSTSGVFKLGPAFGYPDSSQLGELGLNYIQVSKMLECIDDPNSDYYNQLVNNKKVDSLDWNSSEIIQHSPTAYYLGVMVQHNKSPVIPEAGSCIFLHCWTAPEDSTAGCTTMSKDDMLKIVKWLESDKNPVLVQLTDSLYAQYKDEWQLPALK